MPIMAAEAGGGPRKATRGEQPGAIEGRRLWPPQAKLALGCLDGFRPKDVQGTLPIPSELKQARSSCHVCLSTPWSQTF